MNTNLIPDKLLLKIPVKDNGEKLINLKNFCPGIIININADIRKISGDPKDICYIRENAAKKLCEARKYLPENHRLEISECYRPLWVQKKIYSTLLNKLKKKHPDWTQEKLKRETDKFVAPAEIMPPHSTGGAVDLTIIDMSDGKRLDMGTKIDDFSEKSYTFSKTIPEKAKSNRNILIKAMAKAGFVNYPTEWWHWSYGDRYWAAVLKRKYSIYKGI